MKSPRALVIAGILISMLLWWRPLTASAEQTKAAKGDGQKVSRPQQPKWFKVPKVANVQSKEKNVPARSPERDPFRVLVVRQSDEPMVPTLPGKRGLQIRHLRVKGIVKTGNQYFAIVDSPPASGGIFLRINDEVSDGRVVGIKEDSVLFQERAVDQLGKPYTREVVMKISGSGGSNQ
jgi:Tfp pilus assembly protein PilP